MAYELRWHPTIPHTIIIPLGGADLHIDEIHLLNAELTEIMQRVDASIYQIYDLRTFTRLPRGLLSDLPYFLQTEAMRHPNVAGMLVTHIAPDFLPVMRIIASAHYRIHLFDTVDEALDYVRAVQI